MLIGNIGSARAQSASTTLAFEVATVKPVDMSGFDGKHYWAHVQPARASYWSMSLKELVSYAYNVKPSQISCPESMNKEHYDIEARFPKGATQDDDRTMLQMLLKERFHLAYHMEKKETKVYALVVGKHGAKLQPALPDTQADDMNAPLKPGEEWVGEGETRHREIKNQDGSVTSHFAKYGTLTTYSKFDQSTMTGKIHFERSKMSMHELAGNLEGIITPGAEQVVIDRTGLKGNYHVTYEYPMEVRFGPTNGDASDPQDSGELARSLDAMGLRLEKGTEPVDVLVIDHAEKPTEN